MKKFILLASMVLGFSVSYAQSQYLEITVMEVGKLGEPFKYFPTVDNGETLEAKPFFSNSRLGTIKTYLNQGYKIQNVFIETTQATPIDNSILKSMDVDFQSHLRKSTFTGRNRIYILFKE